MTKKATNAHNNVVFDIRSWQDYGVEKRFSTDGNDFFLRVFSDFFGGESGLERHAAVRFVNTSGAILADQVQHDPKTNTDDDQCPAHQCELSAERVAKVINR